MWFGQVKIESSELKWQYMRASGAGGQGVNTADSAVSKLFYEDDIRLQHLTLPNRYQNDQRFVLPISLLGLPSKVKNKEVRCVCMSGHSRNLDIYAGDESIQGVLLTVPLKK